MKRLFVDQTSSGKCRLYYYGDGPDNRVLLERLLRVSRHPQEHMIPVVKALRRIEGADPGYKAARAVWNDRVFWFNNTEDL